MTKSTITRERLANTGYLPDGINIYHGPQDESTLVFRQNDPVIGIDLASGFERSVKVRYVAPPGYVMVPKDLLSDLRDWAHPEIEKYCEMWEGRRDSEFPALRKVIADADALLAAALKPQNAQQNIPEIIPGWTPVSERMPDCWCRTCRPVVLNDMRFVVCPDCGNKRCPRANDHRNACTGSNEPGQEGSAYPASPQSPGSDPATVPGKWIPVSEQMPPSRHEVLVGCWWGEKPRWCCKWATYIPGHPDAQSSGWLIPGASWTPTHWMEMPAGPKEVK